jgi:hypothetical protein
MSRNQSGYLQSGDGIHALKGEMTVWQYGVRHGPNGELQQAPRQKVELLAHSSLRVEPYATPYTIVTHE